MDKYTQLLEKHIATLEELSRLKERLARYEDPDAPSGCKIVDIKKAP